MTAPTEQTGWTYQEGILGFDVLHPNGDTYSGGHIKGTAIDICSRFNRLDALQRQLSEAEKELPSEEEVEKFIVKRFLNETGWSADQQEKENIQTHGKKHTKREVAAAKWMRSEASKTIAGLQSQLSAKEKENERLREALKTIDDYGDLHHLESQAREVKNIIKEALTPKQG